MSEISKPDEGGPSSAEARRSFDDVIAEAKRRVEALAALEGAFAAATDASALDGGVVRDRTDLPGRGGDPSGGRA